MSDTKQFHVGDVLSVTTGILVGPSHMDGIYAVLDHLEQRPHWTHELPDASRRVKDEIIRQCPDLAEAHPPEWDRGGDVKAQVDAWVQSVCDYLGHETVDLAPCPQDVRDALPPVDPIATLQEKIDRRPE